MSHNSSINQIFFDHRNRRWKYFLLLIFLLSAFLILFFASAVTSVVFSPDLPDIKLPPLPEKNSEILNFLGTSGSSGKTAPLEFNTASAQSSSLTPGDKPKILAFYVNWDDGSLISLERNANEIGILSPEWLHLKNEQGELELDDPGQQKKVRDFIEKNNPGMQIYPLVNNYDPAADRWNGEILAKIFATENSREQSVNSLLGYLSENNDAGIVIDFENMRPADQTGFILYLKHLYSVLHPRGIKVLVTVPLADTDYQTKLIGQYCDEIILLALDENVPGVSLAGPISSRDWYEKNFSARLREMPENKYIISLGGYGYDWQGDTTAGMPVSFIEALQKAKDYKKEINIESKSLNPFFNYTDESGVAHQLHFLDATTVFNQMIFANKAGRPAGYALWRLGSEDPSVWKLFEQGWNLDENSAQAITKLEAGYDIKYRGQGEILRLIDTPVQGQREITFDSSKKYITGEKIQSLPSSYVIERRGKADKKIALTFDDGPDEKYTPGILDILKEHGVPATFFIIGFKAKSNYDILGRIADEGHELGNHTFTHPDVRTISMRQFSAEIDLTERIIEGATGHKSLFYRPPYALDVEPFVPEEIRLFQPANSAGYFTVAMNIDPRDWSRPGVREIVDRTVSAARSGEGNIVVLHDSGGNRNQTIQALPLIIEKLKAEGFQFVSVSDLLGVPQSATQPEITNQDNFFARVNFFFLTLSTWTKKIFIYLFFVSIFLVLAKIFFISFTAIVQKINVKKSTRRKMPDGQPEVAVIIPAFNEEKVVVRTVKSVLDSQYPNMKIFVVDDGSTDSTYDVLRFAFRENDQVVILRKSNEGKSSALNFGIARTLAEIIITLDADTIFRPDTITKLVRHFSDKRIGAVAGNAKVGNRTNVITRMQALEYITSQNLDRRAFSLLNCISVVPGSDGAWRRSAVIAAGGFSPDTLAEDADLTFSIIRSGYRIIYEDEAVSYTEAPENLRNFLKQRFRWMYGTLQTVWKHRGVIRSRDCEGLRLVTVPNVLIFQVLFQIFAPLLDAIVIFSLVWLIFQKFDNPENFSLVSIPHDLLFYYFLFLEFEIVAALIPFYLEKNENWKLLFWLPLQRFYYRQIMYLVSIKTIFAVIKGSFRRWNKFERHSTVFQALKLSDAEKSAIPAD